MVGSLFWWSLTHSKSILGERIWQDTVHILLRMSEVRRLRSCGFMGVSSHMWITFRQYIFCRRLVMWPKRGIYGGLEPLHGHNPHWATWKFHVVQWYFSRPQYTGSYLSTTDMGVTTPCEICGVYAQVTLPSMKNPSEPSQYVPPYRASLKRERHLGIRKPSPPIYWLSIKGCRGGYPNCSTQASSMG